MKMSTFLISMRKNDVNKKHVSCLRSLGVWAPFLVQHKQAFDLYSKLVRIFGYRNHIMRTPYKAGYFRNVTNKSIEDKGRYKKREG